MHDLQKAIEFAAAAHRGQWREGDPPLPYITHPIDVLAKLRYVGEVKDPAMLCAAVLHDLVEETDVTLAQIAELFGEDVADLVRQLTRQEPTAEETAGMTKAEIWKLRSCMLLEEIRTQQDPRAQAVKLADRLANLEEAYRTKKGEKLDRYVAQSKEILKIVPPEVNPKLHAAVYSLATARPR